MLTKEEERQFISLAEKIEPVMSAQVFNAVAEKFVLTAIELFIFRQGEKGLEVFLLRRPENDKHWPNLWHNPGTVLRTSDFTVNTASVSLDEMYKRCFERLEEKELGVKIKKAEFVGNYFINSERGFSNLSVFTCELESEPKEGRFFPLNSLPTDIVRASSQLIEISRKIYEAGK